eukprot:g2253.t1 g2253   contig11:1023356-1026363(+)
MTQKDDLTMGAFNNHEPSTVTSSSIEPSAAAFKSTTPRTKTSLPSMTTALTSRRRLSLLRLSSGHSMWQIDSVPSKRLEKMMRRHVGADDDSDGVGAKEQPEPTDGHVEAEYMTSQTAPNTADGDGGEKLNITPQSPVLALQPIVTPDSLREQLLFADPSLDNATNALLAPEAAEGLPSVEAAMGANGINNHVPFYSNNNMSVVNLGTHQTTWLDFGGDELNTIGQLHYFPVLIQAPGCSTQDGAVEDDLALYFDVEIVQCAMGEKGTGILCGLADPSCDSSANIKGVDQDESNTTDPIQFTLREGVSAVVYVSWRPNSEGGIRETLSVKTTLNGTTDFISKESIVVVGTATKATTVDDAAVQQLRGQNKGPLLEIDEFEGLGESTEEERSDLAQCPLDHPRRESTTTTAAACSGMVSPMEAIMDDSMNNCDILTPIEEGSQTDSGVVEIGDEEVLSLASEGGAEMVFGEIEPNGNVTKKQPQTAGGNVDNEIAVNNAPEGEEKEQPGDIVVQETHDEKLNDTLDGSSESVDSSSCEDLRADESASHIDPILLSSIKSFPSSEDMDSINAIDDKRETVNTPSSLVDEVNDMEYYLVPSSIQHPTAIPAPLENAQKPSDDNETAYEEVESGACCDIETPRDSEVSNAPRQGVDANDATPRDSEVFRFELFYQNLAQRAGKEDAGDTVKEDEDQSQKVAPHDLYEDITAELDAMMDDEETTKTTSLDAPTNRSNTLNPYSHEPINAASVKIGASKKKQKSPSPVSGKQGTQSESAKTAKSSAQKLYFFGKTPSSQESAVRSKLKTTSSDKKRVDSTPSVSSEMKTDTVYKTPRNHDSNVKTELGTYLP